MSCNCTTNEQLKELYKRFGEKAEENKGKGIKYKIKRLFEKTGIFICLLVITPILFLYVLFTALFSKEKKISLRKFFRLKGNMQYVGQQ